MKRFVSLILCAVMAVSLCGCTMLDYKKAVMLYEGGGYEGAKEMFEALGDHEDSAEYARKSGEILAYRSAVELYAEENYFEAAAAFEAMGGYEDSEKYLAKCNDKLMAEKIQGRWKTEEVDLTDLLRGFLMQEMASLGYGEVDLADMEPFALSAFYSFEEYGLVVEEMDESGLTRIAEIIIGIARDLMLQTTEQELLIVAEENEISYDELLANLGVANVEEYLASVLGMSLDEYLMLVYNEETLMPFFTSIKVTGAWYVRDGELFVVAGEESERGSYDAENDSITMLEAKSAGENAAFYEEEGMMIYPYTLTRAEKDTPTA